MKIFRNLKCDFPRSWDLEIPAFLTVKLAFQPTQVKKVTNKTFVTNSSQQGVAIYGLSSLECSFPISWSVRDAENFLIKELLIYK